ncbi:MAG: hypothetical protein KF708_22785 [Pirellulales bacterium]|nr:hypothetical protein [Pirellulales bacterium]
MLSVSTSWNAMTSKLTVTGTNGADQIYLRAVGGYVNVENESGSVVHWSGSGDGVTPGLVQTIEVLGTNNLSGSDGADKINLSAVTAGNGFTNITGTTLNGGAGDDSITGSAFADLITGHKGNDTINCGDGNDTVVGSGDGGEGYDSIHGEGGDDSLHGGGQGDSINGGDGADIIFAGDGSEGHELHGGAGNDTITGSDGAEGDTISGGAGNDVLTGGNGSDVYLYVGSDLGSDTINENADQSNDWIDFSGFSGGAITINIGITTEQTVGTNTKITLSTTSSIEDVTGTNLADSITGNSRPNWLEGKGAADTLIGLGGDDTLEGGGGNDSMVGGSGIDTYLFIGTNQGSDTIDEGTGDDGDRLDFGAFGAGITLHLGITSLQAIGGSTSITLLDSAGLEHFYGSNHAEHITGNDRPNDISGNGGDDTIIGGSGDDTLWGGDGADTMSGGSGNDVLMGGAGNDSLTAGAGNDCLFGADGDDTLVASIGNDMLFGEAGNDLFRADLVVGAVNVSTDDGPGDDSLTVNMPAGSAGQAVSIDLDSVNISNGIINFRNLARLQLHTADGADTINVFQPDIGELPPEILIVSNGGNDTITILLGVTPHTTLFAIHGGVGSNLVEVRGTPSPDYFELDGSSLDAVNGSRVLFSDVAHLTIDALGGNDHIVLRDSTLVGITTVLGGSDADRIELASPNSGNFVLSGDAGDDTIVVREPLTSGTTVQGGPHVTGDVLDLSHNGLSAANLPVSASGIETVDLSYNAFVAAPNLPAGIVTADLRYNSLTALSNLAAVTTLRKLLLHGNSNTPDFSTLRGRLFKTDLPAVGLEKAERISNAEDALMGVARALHFSPVEIYEYVLNNFEFQAYAGLMKGVRGTLLTRAGNSWDLSELLIGLLNAAGTSLSNLSYTTAQVLLPFDRGRAWLGVETDQAARDVLSLSGLHSVMSVSAGGFIIDHAWVDVNFSGVGGSASVALDPAWKFRDYRPGIKDVVKNLPFSISSSTLESQYLSEVRDQLPYEWYEDRIAEYLREHYPGAGLADISREGPIRAQTFDFLPSFVSGMLIKRPAGVPSGPDFSTYASAPASYFASHSATGPELFTHRLQLVISNGTTTPDYVTTLQTRNIGLEPIFITWVDIPDEEGQLPDRRLAKLHVGNVVTTIPIYFVQNDLGFANQITLTLSLFEPGTSHSGGATPNHAAKYTRKVGTSIALGLDANQSNDVTLAEQQARLNELVENRSMNDFGQDGIGHLLTMAVWTHYRRADQANAILDAYAHTVRSRNRVEAGMTSSTRTLILRPDVQNPYVPQGLFIDIKDVNYTVGHDIYATDASTLHSDYEFDRARLQMFTRSVLEHGVWEEVVNAESISTIKALQIANANSGDTNFVQALKLGQTPNLASFLTTLINNYGPVLGPKLVGTSSDTKAAGTIWGYLNNGAIVRVHTHPIVITGGNWTGVGYLAEKSVPGDFYYIFGIADEQGNSGNGGGASTKANAYSTPLKTVASHIEGDPVNISNGSVYEEVIDIEIPRPGLPLNFARYYDSSLKIDRGLGLGWTHTYSHFLEFNPTGEPTGTVAWTDDKGIRTIFRPNGSGGYIIPDTRRGEFRRVLASGGVPEHYLWRDKTGFTLEFEKVYGALTKMSDRNGNIITFQYDPAQHGGPVRLRAAIHNATNNGLIFHYNAGDDRFDRIQDMAGREWRYLFNDGLLREVKSPSSSSTLESTFQYAYGNSRLDPTHFKLKQVTQPDGGVISYRYYPNGRAFQVTDPEGYVQTFQYDQHKNEARFIDERLHSKTFVYNAGGGLEKQINHDRGTEYTLWNDGLVRERIGPLGISEGYQYFIPGDGGENERLGNVTAIRRFFRYGGATHAITDLFDGTNPPRHMQVDELFTYQSLHEGGNPNNPFLVSVMTSSTDRVGTLTNYGYDAKGNVTGMTRAVGQAEQNTTAMTYLANGLLQSVTQPRGTASSGIPDDFKTTYTYDVFGSGKVASTTTWISAGVSAVETFQYDSFGLGQLNEYVNANNQRTLYTNDLLGRRIVEIRPEQFAGQAMIDRTWKTKYFRNGLVEMTTEPNGRTPALDDRSVLYTYDLRQLPISTTFVPPAGDPTDKVTLVMGHDAIRNVAFQTDGRGGLTRLDYDARNRPWRTIHADGATVLVSYSEAGQPLVMVDALGRRTRFEYDKLGRLIKRTDPDPDGSGSPVWNFRYDDLGNRTAVIDPLNSRTDTAYDRLSRVTSVLFVDPDNAGPLLRRRITNTYYEDGDLRAVSEDVPNTSLPVRRTEFDVDGLHRRTVERFKEGGPSGTQLYSTATTYDAVGNVKSFTDRLGHTTNYDYNARNELVTVTQPAPFGGGPETRPVWQYAYDANGNRTLETDPRGNQTRTSYDRMNRPVLSERLDSGNVVRSATSVAYDSAGNQVSATDPLGRTAYSEFDERNRRIEHLDALLTSTKTSYDLVGNVVLTLVSAGGGQLERPTLYEYDKLNRLIRRVDSDPDGGGPAYVSPVWRYEYDKLGNLTKVIDPRLNPTQFTYDRLGREIEEKDALNQISRTTYDNFGNVAKTDDRRGRSFSYEYDALNHLTHTRQWRYPGGGGTQILVGHVVTIFDANGNLLDEAVDVLDVSNLDNVHSVATRHTYFGYDALDRRTSVTDNDGKSWITTYDKAGNIIAETDPLARRTEFNYDALNRPTTRRIMDGANVFSTWTTTYDAAGNVQAETDPLAQATSYQYDRLDRAVRVTDPRGFVTVHQFDPFGNQTALIDATGNTTRWTYDALNRLRAEQQFTSAGALVGGTVGYFYDAAGNLTHQTDRRNNTTLYVYNALNRLVTEEWRTGGTFSGTPVRSLGYEYDPDGLLTRVGDSGSSPEQATLYEIAIDAAGRVGQVDYTGPYGLAKIRAQDTRFSDGQVQHHVTRYEPPGGPATVLQRRSAYDVAGRLSSVIHGGNSVDATPMEITFAYNAAGELTGLQRFHGATPVGSSAYAYQHPAGWQTSVAHFGLQGAIAAYDLTYRPDGRLASLGRTATPDFGTYAYSYDQTGQLLGVNHSGANDESYGYDATGNRTSSSAPGLATAYQTDSLNRVIDDGTYTYTYDADGNQLTRTHKTSGEFTQYGWDHRNRLVSVITSMAVGGFETSHVEYLYDYRDRRVARLYDTTNLFPSPQPPSSVTHYLYNELDQVILELFDNDAGGSGVADVRHRYAYGPLVDQVLLDEADLVGGGRELRWLHADQQGTVRDVSNNAGAIIDRRTFDSFGRVTSDSNGAVDVLFGYTGQEYDATVKLHYYDRRWYDPDTARFLSQDPAWDDINPYRYVGNDAVNATDPTGLAAKRFAGLSLDQQRTVVQAAGFGLGSGFGGTGAAAVASSFSTLGATMIDDPGRFFNYRPPRADTTPESVGWEMAYGAGRGLRAGAYQVANTFSFGLAYGQETQHAWDASGLNGTWTQQITVGAATVSREALISASGVRFAQLAQQGYRGAYTAAQGVAAYDAYTSGVSLAEGAESFSQGKYVQGTLQTGAGFLGLAGTRATFRTLHADEFAGVAGSARFNEILVGPNRALVEQPRDALGRFLSKSGGEVRPGYLAEQATFDAVRQKSGWRVISDPVYVRDATGQLRVYDGAAISPGGRYIGLETKSGTGRLTPAQRDFDFRLNSSRANTAQGVGQSSQIVIERAIEVRR